MFLLLVVLVWCVHVHVPETRIVVIVSQLFIHQGVKTALHMAARKSRVSYITELNNLFFQKICNWTGYDLPIYRP